MAIPPKSMRDIRTLSGRVDRASLPYRAYMKLSCLEMERARRLKERQSACYRIANIDARLEEIELEQEMLLQALGKLADGNPGEAANCDREAAPRQHTSGFKFHY